MAIKWPWIAAWILGKGLGTLSGILPGSQTLALVTSAKALDPGKVLGKVLGKVYQTLASQLHRNRLITELTDFINEAIH